MAETTHTLKFRADSRAVKVLGQDIQKAFDPRSPREFRRELGSLQRRLKDITAAQVTLVKELQRVEEGTDAYKTLEKQLGAVEDQAKTVKTAIGGITSAFKDFNAEKRRGFGAGLAQGLGVAQYIPSEAGMGRRIAGGVIGGGVRRAFGRARSMATAPLMNPGIGGLTTMLSGIPVVGPMAGGAIQALSGMYQEAVAYHQARVNNIAFIDDALGRSDRVKSARLGGLPGGKGRWATGADWDARMKKAHAEYQSAQQDLNAAERDQELITRRRIDPNTLSRRQRGVLRASIAEEKIRSLGRGGVGAYGRAAGAGAPSITKERDRMTRVKVEESKERLAEAQDRFLEESRAFDSRRKSVEARRRRARDRRAFGRPFIPSAGFGIRFGFRAAETQAAFTQFMQAAGGSSAGVRGAFEESLAAQRIYGVQAGTSGQFERMLRPGGGGSGGMNLARTLQMATQLGLKGSLVPEYLQSLVQLGQQAEKQGVKINVQEFGRSAALLRTTGIRGPQLGRITSGLNQAAMGLSQRGVSSPVDMIMMRAAGYDPSQGPEGYAAAINKLEGGMNLDMLNNLMSMATRGARGGVGGAGRQTTILMMKRLFGRMSTPLGAADASKLLDAYHEGKLGREHLMMLGRDISQGEAGGARRRLVRGASISVGMEAGLTKTEAALEARRIGLGSKMAGVMVTLNTATLNAASAVSNFRGELNTVAKWMAGLTKNLSEATEGGSGAVWAGIKTTLGL